MLTKLKYFAVAVKDINEGVKLYEDAFGLKKMTAIEDSRWGFKRCMMGNGTEAWVEVMSPEDPNSALARFMRDNVGPGNPNGEGVYLVGFEVDDMQKTVDQAKAVGVKVNQDPSMPNVAWVHPLSMHSVFIELQMRRS